MVAAENKQSNSQGLAIASLTLGILSIPLDAIGIGIILGVLAVIFGAISVRQGNGRKKSIAGIITGSIGILLLPVLFILIHLTSSSLGILQSNSADTARKTDTTNIASEVVEYKASNEGRMPSKYDLPKAKLVKVSDIKQAAYDGYGYDGNPKPTLSAAVYTIGENCGGEKGKRNFSITILLENSTVYCAGS